MQAFFFNTVLCKQKIQGVMNETIKIIYSIRDQNIRQGWLKFIDIFCK